MAFVVAAATATPQATAWPATAHLVADLNPGPAGDTFQGGSLDATFMPLGKRVLFIAPEAWPGYSALWSTDGTPNGTSLILSGVGIGGATFLGTTGELAFFATSPNSDGSLDLWRTDGSREGTYPLFARYLPSFGSSLPEKHLAAIGRFFFQNCHRPPANSTCDLWVTDGTEAGTRVLLSGPFEFEFSGPLGNRVCFVIDRETGELWRTDGTVAGTTKVGSVPRFSVPVVEPVGTRLLVHDDNDLWASDGTTSGTKRIRTFTFLAGYSIVVAESKAYFQASTGGDLQLWQTDGTAAGTVQLSTVGIDDFTAPVRLGDAVYFTAKETGGGWRLWTSQGSALTTRPFTNCGGPCPAASEGAFVGKVDGKLFFPVQAGEGAALWSIPAAGKPAAKLVTLTGEGIPVRQIASVGKTAFFLVDERSSPWAYTLWRTDATQLGTRKLQTYKLAQFSLEAAPNLGRVFLSADDGLHGVQVWTSNGFPEGTLPVTSTSQAKSSHPAGLDTLGDRVTFFACATAPQLWTANEDTVEPVADVNYECPPFGFFFPPVVTRVGDRGFFVTTSYGVYQLQVTDGTRSGTTMVKVLDGVVREIAAFQGLAWFLVQRHTPVAETSLWRSDGTPSGTQKVVSFDTFNDEPRALAAVGNGLYFVSSTDLYRTDGSAGGTRKLTEPIQNFYFTYPPEYTKVGSIVCFARGGELWRTDGTAAGTRAVFPAVPDRPTNVAWLSELGGALLFAADGADGARGLWRTDGTAEGTTKIAAVRPLGWTAGTSSALLGSALFFGGDEPEHGAELWRTDGTAAGTTLAKDISPKWTSSNPASFILANQKVFFTANDLVHGAELWQSDGTAGGTHMVQDLAPGGFSSDPQYPVLLDDELFFGADDGTYGRELWALPLDPALPPCTASPEHLCLGNGRYQVEAFWRDFAGNTGRATAVSLTADTGYFWFFDPANVEVVLKVLDGTGVNGHHWVFYGALSSVEYSLTVTDTQTGAARRYVNPPNVLASVGDTTAFGPKGATPSNVSAGPRGQVWAPLVKESAVSAPAGACVGTATRLCLNGGRFALEIAWKDFQGHTGVGTAHALSGDTGYFWFFNDANVEVVTKVLDGRPLNGKFWVFYGALSSVEYTLTVTDTQTGKSKQYKNPSGRLASVADTSAF